ncbi:MAG: ammonium transporter, partial [Glycomyces artemisiae]|nr:ammonium transporter [Glycomyces artemisiae]
WLLLDRPRGIKPSIIGGCSGVVAGLVAITPAAGYVTPLGAIAIGAVAGIICPFAIGLKHKFGFDDALDVVGLHMVAGFWGSVSLGLFTFAESNALGVDGLFYGGGFELLGKQAAATGVVLVYSAVVAFLIGLILKFTMGIRISEEEELAGIDAAQHGEAGYDLPVNGNTSVDAPVAAGEPEKVNA